MQKKPEKDMSYKYRKTNRLHHRLYACVCLYVSFFYPQALGLLGLVATILSSSPTATQSLSLGVTTHRHPSCYCVFVPALHQLCSLMGHFFLQYLNRTTLNAYSYSKQIRHTKTNVLNICIDMHGPLPEQELFWTKYPRTHCVSVR